MNASRSCTHCARPLPDGSPSSRRYCSAACRTAAYRARTTSTPPHPAVARVAELEAQLVAAETRIGQLTAATRRKTNQVKYLARLLAAERRSADTAITDQAERTKAVRSANARLAGQVADLRRSWSVATADTDLTPDQVAALRGQLAAVRGQLQGIVRQWDTLCRRLAKAVAGQPVSPADKRILATHARFRSALAGPDRTRGGGQPRTAPATDRGGVRP